jgi:hypothetical protein
MCVFKFGYLGILDSNHLVSNTNILILIEIYIVQKNILDQANQYVMWWISLYQHSPGFTRCHDIWVFPTNIQHSQNSKLELCAFTYNLGHATLKCGNKILCDLGFLLVRIGRGYKILMLYHKSFNHLVLHGLFFHSVLFASSFCKGSNVFYLRFFTSSLF